jgi:[ribosomal protein S5]-alanine N-acetyltransferase
MPENRCPEARADGVVLTTGRLVLREFTPGDADFIVRLLNDPGWLANIGDRNVRTADDARAYLERGPIAAQREHGYALWAVEESARPGLPVGMCGLVRREVLDAPDLGYAFLPEGRGRGLASEAARAVLAHARSALGLPRVLAIVKPGNAASARVLVAAGMHFVEQRRLPGYEDDSLVYSTKG